MRKVYNFFFLSLNLFKKIWIFSLNWNVAEKATTLWYKFRMFLRESFSSNLLFYQPSNFPCQMMKNFLWRNFRNAIKKVIFRFSDFWQVFQFLLINLLIIIWIFDLNSLIDKQLPMSCLEVYFFYCANKKNLFRLFCRNLFNIFILKFYGFLKSMVHCLV